MVPPLLGLQVLTRANRRRGLHRQVPRQDLSFRNLEKLARIVKKREFTQGLEQFTQKTMNATSDAITMAQQDDSYRRSLDAAAVALILPFIIGWRHRHQRKFRKLEASLFRMKDKYQGCRVKIYSIDQMHVGSEFFQINNSFLFIFCNLISPNFVEGYGVSSWHWLERPPE